MEAFEKIKTLEKAEEKSSSWFRTLLPVCLIAIGIAGGLYYKSRQPDIKRKPPAKQIAFVETIRLSPGDYQGAINVMGTVMPDKEVMLKARVSGEVLSIAKGFVAGGQVKKGAVLLVLDDSDYKIEVEKAQSALEKALSALDMEKGSQLIAKEELKLINEASQEMITATDLALRKPQLLQAQAAIKSARADFQKAKLNLSRTRIHAPFNALVVEKNVEKGSLVTSQGTICTLVDVDFYKIEAQIAPDLLSAFVIDETKGSTAMVYSRYSNQTWQGKVVRTTGKITTKSRMAGVIVLVKDPLGLSKEEALPQMLLGDHVDVRIMGKMFKNIYILPRNLLRENQSVWVYDNGVLEIRRVEIAWKEDGRIFVSSGIEPEDKLISSNLVAPVKGMALKDASAVKKTGSGS